MLSAQSSLSTAQPVARKTFGDSCFPSFWEVIKELNPIAIGNSYHMRRRTTSYQPVCVYMTPYSILGSV
jgi:hypothetical protein